MQKQANELRMVSRLTQCAMDNHGMEEGTKTILTTRGSTLGYIAWLAQLNVEGQQKQRFMIDDKSLREITYITRVTRDLTLFNFRGRVRAHVRQVALFST